MKTPARISHRIPGRVRLRLRQHQGEASVFDTLAGELAMAEGVESISTSPDTASLLIQYDPQSKELPSLLEKLFELEEPAPADTPGSAQSGETDWLAPLKRFCQQPNAVQSSTALLLIAYGIWQLSRGRRLGPDWFNAFWVAFNLLAIKP